MFYLHLRLICLVLPQLGLTTVPSHTWSGYPLSPSHMWTELTTAPPQPDMDRANHCPHPPVNMADYCPPTTYDVSDHLILCHKRGNCMFMRDKHQGLKAGKDSQSLQGDTVKLWLSGLWGGREEGAGLALQEVLSEHLNPHFKEAFLASNPQPFSL